MGSIQVIEIFPGPPVPGRDHEKSQYLAVPFAEFFVQAAQCLNKNIYSFVFEFIAAANAHHQSVIIRFFFQQRFCNVFQPGFSFRHPGGVLVVGRSETVLKSVGRHHIDVLFKEMGALPGGDIAHGGKNVGIHSRRFLQRVFGYYIVFPGFFSSVVIFHLIVKGKHVSRNTTAQNSGMRSKGSGHRQFACLQIKKAGSGHPFVELSHTFVMRGQIKPDETFNDNARSIAE